VHLTSGPLRPPASQPASGFTLAELTIALVLLGLVLGATMTVLVRQQKFYRSAADLSEVRDQLRQAIGAIPADLRGISPGGNDFYALTDKSVEFRAVTGSTIICQIVSTTEFRIPPQQLANGNTLTVWSSAPQAGDSLFVFDDSTSAGAADDRWVALSISSITPVTGANGCQVASGFVQAADQAQPSYDITVPAGRPLPVTVLTGAPIRFFRRTHYELYQATSGNWYLGHYTCRAGQSPVCNALQPLAGPYRAYSSSTPGTSGLLFSYFDSTGTALAASLANAPKVSRIQLSVRGQAKHVEISGMPKGTYNDSLVVSVGVRNRR
jgi:type II secretory pathway pseudopilin PulG